MTQPFALPAQLPPDLARVEAYWRGLLRGGAEMPFWDDARLTDLPDLAGRLLLIDVFQGPERFRLDTVGSDLGATDLRGRFLDEIDAGRPFDFLRAQCSATVESAQATCRQAVAVEGAKAYARLLLPMWGDGRISMLLGAVHFG